MAKRSRPLWFLPPWVRKQIRRHGKVAELRAAHGDNCWRCNRPMRFEGKPNCGKAATIEHLIPVSKGGGGNLENLRLCHVGCNRHLADRPLEQKERMRINVASS